MRSLASKMIDSLNEIAKDIINLKNELEKYEEEVIELSVKMTELTSGKRKLKNDLSTCEEELVELNVQVAEHQETCKNISCENDFLSRKLSYITK